MNLLVELQRGWAIIQEAPAVAMSLLAAVATGTWFLARFFYSSKVATLEERVKLRDDQLSGKFHNTPPDEAMNLIKKIQEAVDAIPREGLSLDHVAVLRSYLTLPEGTTFAIDVVQNGFASDALLRDIRRLFSNLKGWKLIDGSIYAGDTLPACGLLFDVTSEAQPTIAEGLVMNAFRQAGLSFETRSGRTDGHDVRLLVSVPL